MGDKLVIGPFPRGLRNDRIPPFIDNDSFPTLVNAYQFRGRIKRKRGTSLLGRLNRFFVSTSPTYNPDAFIAVPTSFAFIILANDGLGNGTANILTEFNTTLETNASLIPGSITITDVSDGNIYTDPASDGILVGSLGGTGTVNYANGVAVITAGAGHIISAIFIYYPALPVMGIEDLILETNQFPGTLEFDTKYSYNNVTNFPYPIYDVSFYKNPVSGTYPGYIQKTNWTATTWNGQDYQQFWTVNYQGALWATNGINIPFDITNIGMQFAPAITITYVSNTATTITLTITNCPLVVGDFVFLNEWVGPTPSASQTLNFQSGYVTSVGGTPALLTVIITLPFATLAAGPYVPGIVQYLTNRSDVTIDSLRWYDGDPTNGSSTVPVLNGTKGWVNFAPPLNNLVLFPNYSISELPPAQYYLVGARMIVPFKDRLLFVGPVIQTSAVGSQKYLQDTVIYSQNGTAYYTASFTGDPSLATTVFNPILVPDNPTTTSQTATPNAYWGDQTGFGGFVEAGLDQQINTTASNEDVLILGFQNTQTRFVFTGNDIIPFVFYLIDSELGSESTFSSINLGQQILTRGSRGYIGTTQTEANRIDLLIPDEVFQNRMLDNGTERVCSQRDYKNEWIYWTYPSNAFKHKFPTQTLFYNYRDSTWGIFYECYTTYGAFRKRTGFTWQTVGTVYPTWESWSVSWNAGSSTLLQPEVLGGNQQGFVMVRVDGTNEGNSLYIQSFTGNLVTSPDHCLNEGDYIVISGCLGTISSQVNGKIFSVYNVAQNTFRLNPSISTGTYLGGGLIKRMYVPFIQTKQFPMAWDLGRKTRIGVQQYLLTTTDNAQIQLQIYLSQNPSSPYNTGPIIPSLSPENSGLIYSTVLYTCPESSNLGLTPANINLNMVTAVNQDQIWHRINTSLIGDTVQLGFTLSDQQMRTLNDDGGFISQFAEIELHGFILDVTPSQMLS